MDPAPKLEEMYEEIRENFTHFILYSLLKFCARSKILGTKVIREKHSLCRAFNQRRVSQILFFLLKLTRITTQFLSAFLPFVRNKYRLNLFYRSFTQFYSVEMIFFAALSVKPMLLNLFFYIEQYYIHTSRVPTAPC